ncbi:MAG: hypothetical protein M1839_008657 [Geoglossum umbratile]|nr:MAG: hypothetical protein M1839_008657 [Geoglossum umbratile]
MELLADEESESECPGDCSALPWADSPPSEGLEDPGDEESELGPESESELESEPDSDDEEFFLHPLVVLRTFAFFDLWSPEVDDDDELSLSSLEGALRFSILDDNFLDAGPGLLDSLSSSASLSEEEEEDDDDDDDDEDEDEEDEEEEDDEDEDEEEEEEDDDP